MNTDGIELSVVIPCLNEAANIKTAICLAQETILRSGLKGEVVVADNHSTDNSTVIAEKMKCNVAMEKERGYGYTLKKGIENAKGECIVIGDADATYDFREIVPHLIELKNGTDLLIGSRLTGRIYPGAMSGLHRYLGTPVLTLLINCLFNTCITDVNCGMRAFTQEFYKKMGMVSGGMEFSSEMIIKAAICGMRIQEFPCSLRNSLNDRRPHLKTWRDGWRHLRLILLFAPHLVYALPGWIMLFLGIFLTAAVLHAPIEISGWQKDYQILFYSIPMAMLGYQSLWIETLIGSYIHFSGYAPSKGHPNQGILSKVPIEFYTIIGALLLFLGASSLIYLFFEWSVAYFGALSETRLGIAAMTFFIFGVQTLVNAFMMFRMKTKVHH